MPDAAALLLAADERRLTVEIRPVTSADLEAVAALERAVDGVRARFGKAVIAPGTKKIE